MICGTDHALMLESYDASEAARLRKRRRRWSFGGLALLMGGFVLQLLGVLVR
jgi:hypothetical protein